MKGVFITFEGIEGCGKTTHIELIHGHLKSAGFTSLVTREPGGTFIGDQIRKILLSVKNQGMFSITELLLYAAARAQHVKEVINPALESGAVVLCDRFSDATEAYQGAARSIDSKLLGEIHQIATSGLKPALTILLDCPVEIGLKRATIRNKTDKKSQSEGRFEQEELKFHERVRMGYLKIARREPNRVRVINAEGTKEEIQRHIVREVMRVLKK